MRLLGVPGEPIPPFGHFAEKGFMHRSASFLRQPNALSGVLRVQSRLACTKNSAARIRQSTQCPCVTSWHPCPTMVCDEGASGASRPTILTLVPEYLPKPPSVAALGLTSIGTSLPRRRSRRGLPRSTPRWPTLQSKLSLPTRLSTGAHINSRSKSASHLSKMERCLIPGQVSFSRPLVLVAPMAFELLPVKN